MSTRLAKSIVVALIAGILVLVAGFGVVRRRSAPPVPDSDTLDYVKHLVWLNNWADAAERLGRMEARSARREDQRLLFHSQAQRAGRVRPIGRRCGATEGAAGDAGGDC